MENNEKSKIKELLPDSEVFPKAIGEMLLNQLDTLNDYQTEMLLKILNEENEQLGKLKQL